MRRLRDDIRMEAGFARALEDGEDDGVIDLLVLDPAMVDAWVFVVPGELAMEALARITGSEALARRDVGDVAKQQPAAGREQCQGLVEETEQVRVDENVMQHRVHDDCVGSPAQPLQ